MSDDYDPDDLALDISELLDARQQCVERIAAIDAVLHAWFVARDEHPSRPAFRPRIVRGGL